MTTFLSYPLHFRKCRFKEMNACVLMSFEHVEACQEIFIKGSHLSLFISFESLPVNLALIIFTKETIEAGFFVIISIIKDNLLIYVRLS